MKVFSTLNYKLKYKLLWLVFAVACLFAYRIGISPTVQAFQQYQNGKKALSEATQAPEQIRTLQSRLAQITKGLDRLPYERSLLFEEVNTFCRTHELSLSKFHPEERSTEKDFEVVTNQIDVQGAYIPMVELLYELEQNKQLGHVASVRFEKKNNRRTKTEYLSGKIVLQNIQPIKQLSTNE